MVGRKRGNFGLAIGENGSMLGYPIKPPSCCYWVEGASQNGNYHVFQSVPISFSSKEAKMTSHFEIPSRLRKDEDVIYDSIYQQAASAFERLLAQEEKADVGDSASEEPTDHEAEDAMLSR
jgi:hypothetical protein